MQKYSDEFKLTAVRLSQRLGVQVKTVAVAREIAGLSAVSHFIGLRRPTACRTLWHS